MPPAEGEGTRDGAKGAAAGAPLRTPELLASLCRDLRAPLASVVTGAASLRSALPEGDETARRVTDAIQRAADRMGVLLASFRDLADLQLHELALDLKPHPAGPLVREAYDGLAAEAASHGVAASLDLEGEMPVVACDRDRFLQLVDQLGQAALRVVPEGGSIVMRAAADANRSVRVALLVKRGARPVGTAPPTPALAIARGLAEVHGGSLSVAGDQDALTLSFALPCTGREATRPAATPVAQAEG